MGNQECSECYAGLVDSFEESYQNLKTIGMESILEAKEFMWDYYAQRDRENADDAILPQEEDDLSYD
jgi:hypothetical protein